MKNFLNVYKELLSNNVAWAKEVIEENKNFFKELSQRQNPKFLWLSCADSRVSPIYITQSKLGEIFEYRSMANILCKKDRNLSAILKYTIEFLHIKNIIVCGHCNCGGLTSIINNADIPIISEYLLPAIKVFLDNKHEIDKLQTTNEKANRLSELNTKEQIKNLVEFDIIKNALNNYQDFNIYGLVYNINNGLLKEICKVTKDQNVVIN